MPHIKDWQMESSVCAANTGESQKQSFEEVLLKTVTGVTEREVNYLS